jgi:hypothetical protein
MKKFVICIDNSGMKASLEIRKIYEVINDKRAEKTGMLRVIDNSGEDYLHSAKRFIPVKLERSIQKELFAVA